MMISDPEGKTILSTLGWVDHDAIWHFDVSGSRAELISLGTGARYLSIHSSGSRFFSVSHHFDGERIELTVHRFSDPSQIVARTLLRDGESEVTGDVTVWGEVPFLYTAYLGFAPWRDFVLLRIEHSTGRIEPQCLGWYDNTYDKGYQDVVDVMQLPGEDFALISVQRSSCVIVHDLKTGTKQGEVDLGGRAGNPALQLRNSHSEIWASDYDTIVVLRRSDLQVLRRACLQPPNGATRQFVGDFAFPRDQDICVVARPFSHDIAAVDTVELKVKSSVRFEKQPLVVVALALGEVVARDWKTGDLLRGRLE